MITFTRRLFKIVLFIGLLALSLRYVRPFHYEWTPAEARAWWRASEWLGVRDPDDLYFVVWVTIEVITAVLAYVAITRLWRHHLKSHIEK